MRPVPVRRADLGVPANELFNSLPLEAQPPPAAHENDDPHDYEGDTHWSVSRCTLRPAKSTTPTKATANWAALK